MTRPAPTAALELLGELLDRPAPTAALELLGELLDVPAQLRELRAQVERLAATGPGEACR